jgi:membrane protein
MDAAAKAREARERAQAAAERAHKRWPLLEFPIELVRRWTRVNAGVLAGHLAFRVFVFLVPLLLVLIALLGFASSGGVDLADQSQHAGMGQELADSIAQAGQQSEQSHLQAGVIGLIALISATSGLVAALRLVVGVVWGVPPKEAPRSKVKTMGWLFPGVLIILAAIVVRQVLARHGLVLQGVGALIVIAVNSVALLGLFWILPRRATNILDLVPGAIAAAAGFACLNIASAVYFTGKLQKSSEVYGALGVAVTVLVYLFLVGQVIVVATIVNTIWYDRAEILETLRAPDDEAASDEGVDADADLATRPDALQR